MEQLAIDSDYQLQGAVLSGWSCGNELEQVLKFLQRFLPNDKAFFISENGEILSRFYIIMID